MLYIKLFIEREKNIGQSAPECPFKYALSYRINRLIITDRKLSLYSKPLNITKQQLNVSYLGKRNASMRTFSLILSSLYLSV